MDRYAVFGNPVAHSRSPYIHARFAAMTGEALHYEALLAPIDGFRETVHAFARDGGRGCNVTVPFKFEAGSLAAKLTPRARLARAVNVLRFDDDRTGWLGDNTDGIGLVRDIERNAVVPIGGRALLLAGAGGAAAGALGALLGAKPARLVIVNRDADRARRLAERHADTARANGVELSAGSAGCDGAGRFDIVVNATSASLHGGAVESVVAASALADGALVLDMMYGPAAAPFLQWAAAHGAVGRDGLGMLVEQAAESFRLWRGVRPDTAPVLAALRAAIDAEADDKGPP